MNMAKYLGLLASMTCATLVLVGSASADRLTSPTGTTYTGKITALNYPGGMVGIHNSIVEIDCDMWLELTVESHGAGKAASGKVSNLSFTQCTNSWHVTVSASGLLLFDTTAGYDGTVRSTGTKITATRIGVTCNYETTNTTFGTIEGGSPAVVYLEGSIPIASGSSALCGSGAAKMTGNLLVDVPRPLYVDNS
ncbi:MAG TPA: hypothetical protein VFS54_09585 [Solirubrobacterales bacterium]|nr:hypothetical protein [Solirubrobacterales bacterium]